MADLIDRQAAIDAITNCEPGEEVFMLENMPSAQPEKRTEKHTETHACDLISKQKAISVIAKWMLEYGGEDEERERNALKQAAEEIKGLPSAQPTLYGYNIEHLKLIATVLQEEDLPPERVSEALTDTGRIVAIVMNEFEKALRKAVEQCTT